MDLIKLFIDRPIMTLMMIASLVVFGVSSYPKIGVDQMPEVDFPVLTITTVLPGADPEAIERDVTEPLEEALNTLPGIDTLRSVNLENVSQVIIRFDLNRNVDVAAQDVRDRVQSTLFKLPTEIQTPLVEKLDMGAAPIMTLALSGSQPVEDLTSLAEDVVKPAIQQVNGVGAVDITGGQERQIQIVFDPDRLRAVGLTAAEAVGALRAQNLDVPGGRTQEPGRERNVKLQAEAKSVDDIRDMVLASPGGVPVHLREVAEIVDGPEEARSGSTLDGMAAIGLVVRKQSGANTVQVAEAVKASIERTNSSLPEGSRLAMVNDGSKFIRASIGAVQHDMLFGGLLAVVVVLIFLRNWRSTLVSALALPVSVIGTFAVMKALNFTFNVVTMLALTLSIGLLIDDAIVVIENTVRRLESGESPREAAWKGTKQISIAVLAVTMSVVAVFIPVAFMDGIMGMFFYQFGVTVAVAVMISYVVSMTLTPALSSRLLREHQGDGPIGRRIEWVLRLVESLYRSALRWMLGHRAVTMLGAVAVLAFTVFVARGLKFTFMPSQDMSIVQVGVEMPIGTPLAETKAQLASLSSQIRPVPGVISVFATAGGGVQEEVHKGTLLVNLVPIAKRTYGQTDFKQFLRDRLRALPDTKLSVVDAGGATGGGFRQQQLQFNLRSKDQKELDEAVAKTLAAMHNNPGLVDVDSTAGSGKPQMTINVDRTRAAALGIPAAQLGQVLRTLLGRDKIGSFRQGGDTYEIKAMLPGHVLADPVQLGSLQVRAPNGQLVELRNLASVEDSVGPSQIERQNQMRQVTVLADLKDYSLGEATTFMTQFAAKELPPTVQSDLEGMSRELGTAMIAFGSALLLGIVLLYIILAAQFESLIHPLAIMTALPFAVIGAIGSLLLANQYMSMFAMIGMIMLMGLVAKNGILLVEFTNQLKAEGKATREALLEAGPVRLRPILMTTIAMIAGMVPVALARGDGAETRVPMAIAVIGGLITSTVLTLGVVPVIYSLLDGATSRIFRRSARPVAVPIPDAVAPAE